MNYRLIYDKLIAKCKLRGLDKTLLDGYYEKHHIVPRCLGGSDEDSNLVLLTGREHFVAHRLLSKVSPDNTKLLSAIAMFMRSNTRHGRSLSSRQFELARKACSVAQRLRNKAV